MVKDQPDRSVHSRLHPSTVLNALEPGRAPVSPSVQNESDGANRHPGLSQEVDELAHAKHLEVSLPSAKLSLSLSLYPLCMCICICVCECAYIHMYIYIRTHLHRYTCVHVYTYVYIHVYIHIHVQILVGVINSVRIIQNVMYLRVKVPKRTFYSHAM